MNFDLTEEQELLRSTLDRFLSDRYDLEKRRGYLLEKDGFNAQNWQALAELGLLMLPFSEDDGGLGGGAADVMPVMETFGKGPLVEPYLQSILMGGALLAHVGNAAQKEQWLPRVMAGEAVLSLAYLEPKGRYNLGNIRMTAKKDTSGFKFNGAKTLVLGGTNADAYIVCARTSGAAPERDGLSLFLLPANMQGLSVRDYRLADGSQAGELTLDGAICGADALIGILGQGHDGLEDVLAKAGLAACCEMLGILDALHAMTLDYLKTRTQFGRPIGSFQALQHRMADHLVNLEMARSSVIRAVATPQDDHEKWLSELYGVRAFVSEVALSIGQDSIQLHGAMGTTDELMISHYLKRLLVLRSLFGDIRPDYARKFEMGA